MNEIGYDEGKDQPSTLPIQLLFSFLFDFSSFNPDVNECEEHTHGCHANATCTDTIGSYRCLCADGFIGDGLQCQGKLKESIIVIVQGTIAKFRRSPVKLTKFRLGVWGFSRNRTSGFTWCFVHTRVWELKLEVPTFVQWGGGGWREGLKWN